MARTRARDVVDTPPKALVSSARRINVGKNRDAFKVSRNDGWQDAAWGFYDTIGEFHFAVNWVGNLLSRAKLYATKDDGDGPKRQESGVADEAVDALFYNEQGRSQMLRQMGIHYSVPGECYLYARDGDGLTRDEWKVVASRNVTGSGGTIKVNGKTVKNTDLLIRSWQPHPVHPGKSTSPARPALPILSEIERLTMHVAAQVDSRLSSAGILFMPNSIAFAASSQKDAEGGQIITGSADAFVQSLMDSMSEAIANRESASALVPIVVTADADAIDKAKLMQFWTGLDENAINLRSEAIRRLALALDMPPEVLTGAGDVNHWSAWAIDESAIKSHTEPLLNQIAADLTQGYLYPYLTSSAVGMSDEEAQQYGIGVDTSEMRLRPNRSQEAIELWDRGELSDKTLRTETGFTEDDAPTDQERRTWFLSKVASGSTTPELVEAALRQLQVPLGTVASSEPSTETQEARPTPSLEDHPDQSPPDESQASILAAQAEVMVFRALERAGNRLKSRMQTKFPGIAAEDLYRYHKCDSSTMDDILLDAWEKVPKVLGLDEEKAVPVVQVLDSYTRSLIHSQEPHDPGLMRQYLTLLTGARS